MNQHRPISRWLLLVTVVSVAGAAAADAPRYAIACGKVVTVSHGVIDDGVVLVASGRIEAVGPRREVPIPAGYELITAPNLWVMPGMVEAHSHTGVGWGINDMVSQINPGMRIGDFVDPHSRTMRGVLAAGVTTLLTIPGSGTNHAGFGVVLKSAGETKEERTLRRVGAMKIAQAYNPERGGGDIGAGRLGQTWILRQHLERLRAYDAAWRAWESGQSAVQPERDLALEDGRQVFRRLIPVLVHTWMSWGMAMTTRMFRDEFDLPAIASHTEGSGPLLAAEVARSGIAVNVGPRVVDFGARGDGQVLCAAAAYDKAGVELLSVNTDALGPDQALLADQASVAARFGVDPARALRMVTLDAARTLMVDDRVGSIEVGKDADLVLKASSLLDPTTPVEMVFVSGRLAYRREGAR